VSSIRQLRAWDKENKKWVYSGRTPSMMQSFWKWVMYDSETIVCEETGLKDRNGTEIYEDDVVRRNYLSWGRPRESVYEISYTNLYWSGYEDSGSGIGFNIELEPDSKVGDTLDNYEVIGNKWEHPELLQRGQS
jgi:uncharacterized phage protein (TIGR01671 family)